MNGSKYAIFDLDNCISDDRKRIPLIDWTLKGERRWDRYHSACGSDPAANTGLVAAQRAVGAQIVIFTARPRWAEARTRCWLAQHIGESPSSDRLWMRRDGDERSSLEIKREMLVHFLARQPSANIVAAYDDREDIVEMYRSYGINSSVLRIHDLDGHPPPSPFRPAPRQVFEELRAAEGRPEDWADVDALAELRPAKDAVTPASVLRDMAATFELRNASYRDNYKCVAPVIAALFPDGVPPQLVVDDRWHLFELSVVKLARAARNNLDHTDSIHDAAVYLAMIESINRNRTITQENGK